MLSEPDEQMAIHYLDHAIAALHDLPGGESATSDLTGQPNAPVPNRD